MSSISTNIPTNIKIFENIEQFDSNLPETVKLLRTSEGSKVYVIGTAHFSEKSQDDVSYVMQNVRPDKLVLELCPMRAHVLYFDEQRLLKEAAELNQAKVLEILKQYGFMAGMFYIKFLSLNASVTRQLGIAPGGECRRALAEAKRLYNCDVYLGDRLIYITMQRAIHSLTLFEKLRMSIFYLLFEHNSKITQDDVENLKQRTAKFTENTFSPSSQSPGVYNAFVHERDILLCHSLQYVATERKDKYGKTMPINVVGVVGIGHSAGIVKNWGKVTAEQVQELMTVPMERFSHRFARLSFKCCLVAFCGYGICRAVLPKQRST